jgi:hypothetical protein
VELACPPNHTSSQEAPDPRAFADRLTATCKDSIPQQCSILFIAYEYIEKWFKALGKNSKEACRMLRADVLPKWHWRDARTITSREVIELLDVVATCSASPFIARFSRTPQSSCSIGQAASLGGASVF